MGIRLTLHVEYTGDFRIGLGSQCRLGQRDQVPIGRPRRTSARIGRSVVGLQVSHTLTLDQQDIHVGKRRRHVAAEGEFRAKSIADRVKTGSQVNPRPAVRGDLHACLWLPQCGR